MEIIKIFGLRPGSPPFCTVEVKDGNQTFIFQGIPCVISPNGWTPFIPEILDRLTTKQHLTK